jgi:hypothetical protein
LTKSPVRPVTVGSTQAISVPPGRRRNEKGHAMSVMKVIEIMGDSDKSWEDAAGEAVAEAAKSVKNIRSVWLKDQAATVEGGKIKRYRATCKITFEVET